MMTRENNRSSLIVHRSFFPRGFTLIQLLVAIGIIVILVALALPAIVKARKTAEKTAMKYNLQAISSALDAYKLDFGDYPRLPVVAQRNTGAVKYDYGSMLLCWALIAPAGNQYDGATGYGFRLRPAQIGADNQWDTADDVVAGKVYGPYLDPSKFKLSTPADPRQTEILDKNGNAYLYYPARPSRPDLSNTNNYVGTTDAQLYNSSDNTQLNAAALKQAVISASYTGPYVLWVAGNNGLYATSVVNNNIYDDANGNVPTDDVNNISE